MLRIAALLFAFSAALSAATIVQETSSTQGVLNVSPAVGFSLLSTWNNVVISMDLATNNGSGSSVTANLTNQISAGFTNVAPSAVIPVAAGSGTYVLFSGLTLGPGNYYFSFTPADGLTGLLGGGAIPPVTTGPGVTSLGTFTFSGAAPGGTNSASTFGMRYLVTGDDTSVPEPSTLGLLGAGLVLMGAFRARLRSR